MSDELNRRITDVADDLYECKTEVGMQVEKLSKDFEALQSDVKELLDIFKMSKGFFRVVYLIGQMVKWVALVAAPLLALYYFITTGHWHK